MVDSASDADDDSRFRSVGKIRMRRKTVLDRMPGKRTAAGGLFERVFKNEYPF